MYLLVCICNICLYVFAQIISCDKHFSFNMFSELYTVFCKASAVLLKMNLFLVFCWLLDGKNVDKLLN